MMRTCLLKCTFRDSERNTPLLWRMWLLWFFFFCIMYNKVYEKMNHLLVQSKYIAEQNRKTKSIGKILFLSYGATIQIDPWSPPFLPSILFYQWCTTSIWVLIGYFSHSQARIHCLPFVVLLFSVCSGRTLLEQLFMDITCSPFLNLFIQMYISTGSSLRCW